MTTIEFSPEQGMLLDIADRFWRERWPIEEVRGSLTSEKGFASELWAEIVDLGWPALAVPEQYGGIGEGLAEVVTLVEPMGRQLFASPFVASQLVVQALLKGGSDEHKSHWLPRLAEGAIAAVAFTEEEGSWELEACTVAAQRAGDSVQLSGRKCFVTDLPDAELVLVSAQLDGEPALVLVERPALAAAAVSREVVIDETRSSYGVDLAGVAVPGSQVIVGAAALLALDAVRRAAWLLIAAEACGGTAAALALIVEYLNSRVQFGKLIGSYQALKHPSVEILIGLERARSHLYHAATHCHLPEAEAALRMAKVAACDAFVFAGDRAVQFHGGLGFTYECDAQLYLRRALWCQAQFGDSHHHRQRLAALLFD